LLMILVACSDPTSVSSSDNELKGKSQGGFSDIIVVAEDYLWNKGLKDDASFVLAEELKGLYRPELNFDITHVRPSAFSTLFKRQRIILVFEVSTSVLKSGVGFVEDKYSRGQLYIKVSAKDFDEASFLLIGAKDALRQKLANHRGKGLQRKIAQVSNKKNNLTLKKLMQAEINISKYYSPVIKRRDFCYFGKKAKGQCQSGQNSECNYQLGLFVSKMNYDSKEVFDKDNFVKLRDSLTKEYIIGPEKSIPTYMEVENSIPVHSRVLTLGGNYCVEYRGWWNMVNATMGGPYVSYLLVDEKKNKLYLVDGFAFAPNFSKRDFLKELEAIMSSIKVN
jgi:hypothetical protein